MSGHKLHAVIAGAGVYLSAGRPSAAGNNGAVITLLDVGGAVGSAWKSDNIDWYPLNGICVLGVGGPSAPVTAAGEAIHATVSIPDLVGLRGQIRVTPLWKYTNSGVTKTMRIRIGGVVVATVSSAATLTAQFMSITRAQGATNAQVTQASNGSAFLGAVNASAVVTSIDLSVSQDLTITGEIASGTSDSMQLLGWIVELIKS